MSNRWLRLLLDNYQLLLVGLGLWLIVSGVGEWSKPLASVVLGLAFVALAVMPHLRSRKDRSE